MLVAAVENQLGIPGRRQLGSHIVIVVGGKQPRAGDHAIFVARVLDVGIEDYDSRVRIGPERGEVGDVNELEVFILMLVTEQRGELVPCRRAVASHRRYSAREG